MGRHGSVPKLKHVFQLMHGILLMLQLRHLAFKLKLQTDASLYATLHFVVRVVIVNILAAITIQACRPSCQQLEHQQSAMHQLKGALGLVTVPCGPMSQAMKPPSGDALQPSDAPTVATGQALHAPCQFLALSFECNPAYCLEWSAHLGMPEVHCIRHLWVSHMIMIHKHTVIVGGAFTTSRAQDTLDAIWKGTPMLVS